MKPFNLKEALAGKPVVTRDGRKVVEVFKMKQEFKQPVIAVLESGSIGSHYTNGFYDHHEDPHDRDLFMAPEKREYWVNVYRTNAGTIYTSDIFRSMEKDEFLATVKVWEEEV